MGYAIAELGELISATDLDVGRILGRQGVVKSVKASRAAIVEMTSAPESFFMAPILRRFDTIELRRGKPSHLAGQIRSRAWRTITV